MNKNQSKDSYIRPNLSLPNNGQRLLLHSCCAPCAAEVMLAIKASNIEFSVYFYNPNIHPRKEYELRKEENIRFCEKHNIPFIDGDYDKGLWMELTRGLEDEPERGIRCSVCFDMRFVRTAQYAKAHGFDTISSTLGISRWKNMEQINRCGIQAAEKYPEISYWDYNWRKEGGSQRMHEYAKEEQFYQQQYCGCHYSLRDTNKWRQSNNREKIVLGDDFYHISDESK